MAPFALPNEAPMLPLFWCAIDEPLAGEFMYLECFPHHTRSIVCPNSMFGASRRRSEIGRENESPEGNSPAWLRCTNKVVQFHEPQAFHHLPNLMARLDTSD